MRFQYFFRTVFIILAVILITCTKENTYPVANLSIDPVIGDTAVAFIFDASDCTDLEDPYFVLKVRWDWDNDGIWDTPYSKNKRTNHKFTGNGYHNISMEVTDRDGLTNTITDSVLIIGANPTSTITDPRDGRVYKTVKLFDDWWMAENLNYGKLISGLQPQFDNNIIEKYAPMDNDKYLEKFGGLYYWYEAMNYDLTDKQGICPDGWHIPTKNEWENIMLSAPEAFLTDYYEEGGPSGFNINYPGTWVCRYDYFNRDSIYYDINSWCILWASTHTKDIDDPILAITLNSQIHMVRVDNFKKYNPPHRSAAVFNITRCILSGINENYDPPALWSLHLGTVRCIKNK
jgi:uncharacterized protein (TIGR02145 family)